MEPSRVHLRILFYIWLNGMERTEATTGQLGSKLDGFDSPATRSATSQGMSVDLYNRISGLLRLLIDFIRSPQISILICYTHWLSLIGLWLSQISWKFVNPYIWEFPHVLLRVEHVWTSPVGLHQGLCIRPHIRDPKNRGVLHHRVRSWILPWLDSHMFVRWEVMNLGYSNKNKQYENYLDSIG